jgi:TonB family protein
MNDATADSPAPEPGVTAHGAGWSLTRWFMVIALVTAAQAGLIFLFGEKDETIPRPVLHVPTLKLADTDAEQLALDDPTLFVLPNPKDFASAAWLTNREPEQPSFRWTEPPRWLPMSTNGLGTALGQLMHTNFFQNSPFNFAPAAELTTPTMPAEPALVQNSTMLIRGELAQRQLPLEISLTNWPYADVLAPCVVQVLVNPAGNVISTVLLKSSSYKDADDKALELARALRFTPAANLAFGRIIFNWQTVPTTNENNR